MNRMEASHHLRLQARSLHFTARSVMATAREIVADTRVACHESEVLLKRLHAMRLHGPLPRGSE